MLPTEQIKNVQMSLDHNSQLYSRVWLNQLVPFLAGVGQMSLVSEAEGSAAATTASVKDRIAFGLSMLELQSKKSLMLTQALID